MVGTLGVRTFNEIAGDWFGPQNPALNYQSLKYLGGLIDPQRSRPACSHDSPQPQGRYAQATTWGVKIAWAVKTTWAVGAT